VINLSLKDDRNTLAARIKSDINEYCEKTYNDGHRDHLGASIMGEACNRKLWYTFRWVKEEIHDGRMQRLFQVGKDAEPRFIKYLMDIGFEVKAINPVSINQFRISSCNGHYGGSLDGMCKAPARYEISEDLIFLNEFKTNGTGAGFTNVEKDGIFKSKPKHYAQLCQYGFHYQLKYGLYIIENKNDSDLTVEIVPLDWNLGAQLENRANQIIQSQTPPERISDQPSYQECKWCHFQSICHFAEEVEKNCRSCKQAKPVENGEWFCSRFNDKIPKDFIKKGCEYHATINI